MSIKGPYADGAFVNLPGQTIHLCVSCANDRDVDEENVIMYDDSPNIDYMECYYCGEVIRDY